MKRILSLALLLGFTLGGSISAQAGDVAFVDMKKILAESEQGKAVQEKIRGQFEAPRQALINEEKAIVQAQKNLKRDYDTMSKEQASRQEAALKQRIGAFQQRGNSLQKKLFKTQQTLAQDVLGPAGAAIRDIAKERDIAMVVEEGTSGLLYLDPKINLTDEVIQRMQSQ